MNNPEDLVFLPLGGCGEIGMNLSLYGHDGAWLMVDCGVTFGDDLTPGIVVMVPDPAFLVEIADKLVGVIVTHAHEDHIGGIPYLWRQMNCPVFATPFAAGLLRRKLSETGLENAVPINEVKPGGEISLGPFDVSFVNLAHSVPETQALTIKTRLGNILHASDWKIDPEPLVGPCTDESVLRAVGGEGVLALMCDSTNVFVEGRSGSEGPLRDTLKKIVGDCAGKVAVACFASNVARMESCIRVAEDTGRRVALIGRSLWRIAEISKECGYLSDCPEFVDARDIGYLPREEVLMLVTGSQGESRAALSRIAADDHPDVTMSEGDTVIFSSREIPGNERAIGRVKNQLARLNVNVITEHEEFVHVSGHPARAELQDMYSWIEPPLLVPLHGESRHLIEHCKFARENGIEKTALAENGEMLRLAPGEPEVIAQVQSGRYAVDGRRLVPVDGDVVRARRRMTFSGVAVVTIVLDEDGVLLKNPILSAPGIVDGVGEDVDLHQEAILAITDTVEEMSERQRFDDDKLERAVVRAARQVFHAETGRRPNVDVHVVRI
ncbi:MAG: MBL fold hydrolase [Rhodospirillaceae bacterium]|nr:MBL fold hydrolase [Rhodospirillaceae bacterium]|tara:strand:+ start:25710 stop:27365 length:1656 start_codon:yes stop_codon:yes gene_type:complete